MKIHEKSRFYDDMGGVKHAFAKKIFILRVIVENFIFVLIHPYSF